MPEEARDDRHSGKSARCHRAHALRQEPGRQGEHCTAHRRGAGQPIRDEGVDHGEHDSYQEVHRPAERKPSAHTLRDHLGGIHPR
jgi:hypothetical protein